MSEQEQANAPEIGIPVHVGTMGWSDADWQGVFYPEGAKAGEYIRLYAQAFDTVEIDSTFYGTPREKQVTQWAQMVPNGFTFCAKVPRVLTHDMRLRDIGEPLAGFVRVMGLLGEKRGPILLQMPPDFTRHELDNLRALLPTLHKLGDPSVRFAIEFRHRSLIGPDVSQLLREHNVALALTDYVHMPRRFELTTDFVYLRLIGRHGDYPKHDRSYADHTPKMQTWADALRTHQSQLTASYVQCNNDYEGYSPSFRATFANGR
jgi:uncharacterized protein YecE (DUF72 family)